MNAPLSHSDFQMDVIRRAAAPLDPDLRSPFLETVAKLLAGEPEIGDGAQASKGPMRMPTPRPLGEGVACCP